MNYLKKLVLTILLASGVLFCFESCIFNCNCPDVSGPFFDVQDISIRNYAEFGLCCDSINWEEYVFSMDLEVTFYGETKQKEIPYFQSLELMPSAKALTQCDCLEEGWNGSEEKIEELVITTVNDFNDTYKANDTINDIVNIHNRSLADYLAEKQYALEGSYMQWFPFQLNEAPTATNFQVNVTLKLDNGETYTAMNEVITFAN